jgi:hypothetical protein
VVHVGVPRRRQWRVVLEILPREAERVHAVNDALPRRRRRRRARDVVVVCCAGRLLRGRGVDRLPRAAAPVEGQEHRPEEAERAGP